MSELVRDWKAEKKDLEEAFDIISDKLVKADAKVQRLKDKVASGRVELREQWKRMQTENLAQKAEIERLKGVIESQNRSIDRHLGLITELCDALKRIPIGLTPPDRELLQRAREAVR